MSKTAKILAVLLVGLASASKAKADDKATTGLPAGHTVEPESFDFQAFEKTAVAILCKAIPQESDATLPPGHTVKPKTFDFRTFKKKDVAVFYKAIPQTARTKLAPGHTMKDTTFDFQTLPPDYFIYINSGVFPGQNEACVSDWLGWGAQLRW